MLTFGKKIGIGFAIAFALLMAIGIVASSSTASLAGTSHDVTHSYQVLERIDGIQSALKDAETGQRGFVITGKESYLAPYQDALTTIDRMEGELTDLVGDNPGQENRLTFLKPLVATKLNELKQTIEMRRVQGLAPTATFISGDLGKKTMDSIRTVTGQMGQAERALLKLRADDVEATASRAKATILWGTLVCLIFVTVAGVFLTRSLTNQIASAVQHIRGSSTELQSAANQQATSAKESSTSMNEISTTIVELLATSRQIAESAQRVAGVAEQTAGGARVGEGTVQKANESIVSIRRQMDLVVNHMLDLGKKSQQIGAVLDIVSELAEQTNILSINATIEAAGAGESGKRFAVVADEIRKLADRVAGSAKEIRTLVDEVRGAVNTTVMATETGSKAVDTGSRQFDDVTASFKQIAGLVATTRDAAREIELSTKQQTTAVEQVNVAIAATAQATKETEASSGQTLQTASQLATLSAELIRLVQPQAAA